MLVWSAQIVLQQIVVDVIKDFTLMEEAVSQMGNALEVPSQIQLLENVVLAQLNSV
jgi:hypothetical protein